MENKKLLIAAMKVVRASQNTTIDSISVDNLKNEINELYPDLNKDWPYRWIINHEEFDKILENI